MQKISDVVKLGLVLEPVELLVWTAYTVAKLWFNFVAKILHHHDEDTKNEIVETDKQVNVFRRNSCENKLSNSGKGKEESGLAISICRDKSEQGGCRKSTSRREFSSGNLIARRIPLNWGNSPTSRRPDMICWIVSCGRHRELLFSSSAIKRKRSRKGPATRWVVCLPCEKGPTLCLAYIGVDSGGGSSKQPHCRYEAQFFPPKIGFAARNG